MARFTIYFATDIHGSERCFLKFLNAGKAYGAHAVILGGDVTGKALVPVVEQAGGTWQAALFGKLETASDEAELAETEKRIRSLGFYPYRTTPEEHAHMAADAVYLRSVFNGVMRASAERWVDMADNRLRAAGLPCLAMPGNDDIPEVKDVLTQGSWLTQAEGHVLELGPYQVLSLGYSTVTPWNSPRELTEEEMADHLAKPDRPDPAGQAGHLQRAQSACRVGHRPGVQADQGDANRDRGRRAGQGAGRQPCRPGRDRACTAGAVAARAHSRVAGYELDRPDQGLQPWLAVPGRDAAGRAGHP